MKRIIIAIDGFSSCGKSTMAKALARNIGYLYFDSGAMYRAVALYCMQNGLINDNKIDTDTLRARMKDIHITFEADPETKNSLTLLNGVNVEHEIRSLEVSQVVSQVAALDFVREEMVERARFCLQRVNMPERAFSLMPSEISGGMQKRVAIARAIALNPRYLFCDEPNSGLDPKTSLVIDQLIQDITQEYGICTIVNSHDMNSIMEIGDNILFLKNGKKEWQGSKDEIMHSDNEALNDFVFASELFKAIKKNK